MIGETTFTIDMDAVVRLLMAAGLGALVGIEREVNDQPAGLRTHIAVALGAGLFGVISTLGFLEFDEPRASTTLQADVTRVASNVVVGIGFLGAGVIFRQGSTIKNLTTAASLWCVAAIGLGAGVGQPLTAAIATVVLLVSLIALRPLRSTIRTRWAVRTTLVEIGVRPGVDPMSALAELEGHGLDAKDTMIEKEEWGIVVRTTVTGDPAVLSRWMAEMVLRDDVVRLIEV